MSDCEFECELLQIIRKSKDPNKALVVAIDIVSRSVAGESMESIAASYGLKQEETPSTITTEEEDTAE